MVHDVALYLGISDAEALQVVALAVQRRRVETDGSDPPHSVGLYQGL
jgi:hypothetical protein